MYRGPVERSKDDSVNHTRLRFSVRRLWTPRAFSLLPQRNGANTDVAWDQNLVSTVWRYLSFVSIAQRADTADFAITGLGLMIRSI
jgi:hypothetical protein